MSKLMINSIFTLSPPLTWQQDGAPCHCTNANITYLENKFNGRIVSRRCCRGRNWPPRSPDLNPLYLYLWGFLKSRVYCPRPANLDQLEANIRREVNALDPATVSRALLDVKVRAHKCIANNGWHLEN